MAICGNRHLSEPAQRADLRLLNSYRYGVTKLST